MSESDSENSDVLTSGNTNESLARTYKTSTKSRGWSFTLNNFSEDDIYFFTDTLNAEKYVFQHEVGESGTHHLQGTVYFTNQRTFGSMKQVHSKCHWEPTKCLKGSVNYCCDPEKRYRPNRIWIKGWTLRPDKKDIKVIDELRPWQQLVVDLIDQPPDDRTINWFWDNIVTGKQIGRAHV